MGPARLRPGSRIASRHAPRELGKLGYALLEHNPALMQRFLGELVEVLSARGEQDAVRAVLAVQDHRNEEV